MRETSLNDLEDMLPDEFAKPVVEYLRATRKVLDHFEEYFELCGVTFRYTSGEVIESMHHNLRMMMENHNLRITDHLGSKIHEDRLLKTICLWNFKNIMRNNNPVPRSVEAIAGAVYGQQF